MSREWKEGELFVWGDDGLVPADDVTPVMVPEVPAASSFDQLPEEWRAVLRPATELQGVRTVGRRASSSSMNVKDDVGADEVLNSMRASSKVMPRRNAFRHETVKGEVITDIDEMSGIVRTAPKVLPHRQRSTYSSDDDFCNDPEELERRRREKKSSRGMKRERPSLFARATGALARREYSRKELAMKLGRSLDESETVEDLEKVLDRLESAGYLSDARFAESRARSRARVMGDARIRRELRQSGVSGEHVDAAMEEIEEPEEVRAYRLWSRRFGELPKDRKERERQIRFLLYRGFSMSAVSRVLKGDVELPEDSSSFF